MDESASSLQNVRQSRVILRHVLHHFLHLRQSALNLVQVARNRVPAGLHRVLLVQQRQCRPRAGHRQSRSTLPPQQQGRHPQPALLPAA